MCHCLAPESISLACNTGQERETNNRGLITTVHHKKKIHIANTYDKTFTYLKSCHKLNRAHQRQRRTSFKIMPDSINKVCSVQFDIHKYIQHLDSFCRVDGNCKGIHRKKITRDYSFKKLRKPSEKPFVVFHRVSLG